MVGPLDTLYVIAEVGTTFAGFVGVMSVFRRTRTRQYSKHLLVDFLVVTLGAVLFSFVPELVAGIGFSDDVTWRIANGTFGLSHLLFIVLSLARPSPVDVPRWHWIIGLLGLCVIAAKLLVGAGFAIDHAYHIYLLGLVWLIVIAILRFADLVLFENTKR